MKRIALLALSLGVVFSCAAFTEKASAGDGPYGHGGYTGRYAGRYAGHYGGPGIYFREPGYRWGYGPGYCPLSTHYHRRPNVYDGYYGGAIYASPVLIPRHFQYSHRRGPRIGLYLGF